MDALKFKGSEIVLADGIARVVPPLNLRGMLKFADFISTGMTDMSPAKLQTAAEFIHFAVARNYPDFTLDEALDYVDISNVGGAVQTIMKVAGLVERPASGEAQATASTGLS